MYMYVCMYVCVCVRERERERECVCVRERERERFRIKLVLDFLAFALNNSFTTKIKNLDGYVVKNWSLIEIKFRI